MESLLGVNGSVFIAMTIDDNEYNVRFIQESCVLRDRRLLQQTLFCDLKKVQHGKKHSFFPFGAHLC